MNVLEINNLRKSFGSKEVLRRLNLSVPEHCIFGFIGKNGAGKTTTMKAILGLLRPDSGQIHVMGFALPLLIATMLIFGIMVL